MPKPLRDRARQLYADALLVRSPTSTNLARNIIDGRFENWWITPGLDATEAALRGVADGDDDDEEDDPS